MRRTSWTEANIDAELRRFLADRRVWPSYAEFVAAGRGGLRRAITRHGGACMWAARVGIEWAERPPGYAPHWTAERVRAELKTFLANRTVWPSRVEFEAEGLKTLREAISRLGGVEAWAAEFGLPRPNLSAGSRRVWDERRLEQTIGPLVERLGRWPTKAEFQRAGLASALTAVYRYGGVTRWRKRLSAAPRRPHGPVPERRVWTEERIERELRAYCRGRTIWPGWHEFMRDGKTKLYRAASLYGGVGRWQKKLGLKSPRPRVGIPNGHTPARTP
jgi:hypothetical protein